MRRNDFMTCTLSTRDQSMKSVSRFLILATAFLALVTTAHAANPREVLKQLTAQLQSNPNDTALREKIIELALTIRPTPAVPAEAERFDGRGEYAFKNAKNETDFLSAAQEFTKASNAAPWVASFYFNAATAYEKAQKPAEAKRHFELYLLASPNAKDARDVRRRIAGLEFSVERAASPEIVMRNLEGARFGRTVEYPQAVMEEVYEIRGGKATLYQIPLRIMRPSELGSHYSVGTPLSLGSFPLTGLEFNSESGFQTVHGQISTDGQVLKVKVVSKGKVLGESAGQTDLREYRRK